MLLANTTSVCAVLQNDKIQFDTDNNFQNQVGGFEAKNFVSVIDYGPKPTGYVKYRSKWLDIGMTPVMYNYFYICVEESYNGDSDYWKSVFLDKFLKGDPESTNPDWIETYHQIVLQLKTASSRINLKSNYFYEMFLNWLSSDSDWKRFRDIFTMRNTKNNTFRQQPNLDIEKRQLQMRQNRVILQFGFTSVDTDQKDWRVDYNTNKIFPQDVETGPLTKYYEDSVVKGGQVINIPPLMDIKLSVTPTKEMTVYDLMPQLKNLMWYNFNIEKIPQYQDLIRIPVSERNKEISLVWKNPTTIDINFYSEEDPPQFYIYKRIRLYVSGPSYINYLKL